MLAVMRSRAREEALQARCCMLLAGMAEGEVGCQRAANAGVFNALAAALTTHASDEHVLYWGAIAVLRLSKDSAVRAQLACRDGVEEALRGPPGGGLWVKVAPPSVASKLDLARRWLALHVRLFGDSLGREARISVGEPASSEEEARGDAAGAMGSSIEGLPPRRLGEEGGDHGTSNSSGLFDRVTAGTPAAAPSKWSTVRSAATMLRAAEALKDALARNMSKVSSS